MASQLQTFIGWLGQNPEQVAAKNGAIGAKFNLGTNYFVGKGENREKKTDWFEVYVWGELAKEVISHFKKGSKAIVYGYFRSRPKKTKSGESYTGYFIDAKEIGAAFNTYASQQQTQGQPQNQNQWNQGQFQNQGQQKQQPYQNGNPYPQQKQNQQWNQSPAGNFSQFGPAYNEPPEYEQDEIPF